MYKFLLLFFSVFLFGSDTICPKNSLKEVNLFIQKNKYSVFSKTFLDNNCYQSILSSKNNDVIEVMFSKILEENKLYYFKEKFLIYSILEKNINRKYIDLILKKENNIEDIKYSISYLLKTDKIYLKEFLTNKNLNLSILYTNLLQTNNSLFSDLLKENLIDKAEISEIFNKNIMIKQKTLSYYLEENNIEAITFLLQFTNLKEIITYQYKFISFDLLKIIYAEPTKYKYLIEPISYYVPYFILFILCSFILFKIFLDVIYQIFFFSFRSLYIQKRFKSDDLNDYKNYSDKSVINYLNANFKNNIKPIFSNHKAEILNISLKNKNSFSYSLTIETNFGMGSGPSFKNVNALYNLGEEEANKFIRNKNNLYLLKEELEKFEFGQHYAKFKSFSPAGSYSYSCGTCCGKGYTEHTETDTDSKGNSHYKTVRDTCPNCGGTGYEHDTVLVTIKIDDRDYEINKISNNNHLLRKSLMMNVLCKNISKYSTTTKKEFILENNYIVGKADFKSLYCESNMKIEEIEYPLKTFGNKAIILDLGNIGDSFFKNILEDYIKPFFIKRLNYINIRKAENSLKRFFKYKNNRIALASYNKTKNYKQASILSKNSISPEYIKQMIYKTKDVLFQLRTSCMFHSIIFSFIGSIYFYNLKNGGFWVFIGSFLLFYSLCFVGYGYFLFKLFLFGGIPLVKYGHSIPFSKKKT